MESKVVGGMSEWSGILKDLFRQIHDGSLTLEQVKAFVDHQNPFEILSPILEWQDFYRKYFGIDADFSAVAMPEHRVEFDRLIIVAQGLTLNQVYDACARQFPCWRWTDNLDAAVTKNDRTPGHAYAVRLRDRREADEELKNLSADQLAEKGIPGITLLERMLYELKYWDETKDHLDVNNVTLCSGSRDAGGHVPSARWYDGYFGVDWYYSYSHCRGLRSRAAVPCPAKRD